MTLITPYQKEALNYKKHISLTANAGSGKTFVLSKRFVEIALNEDVPLNSIVAITFTDKAASELYKKIAGEINDRLDSADENMQYAKLLRLRRQLVSAKISTIHSFCSELLREFSPEAGLDSNFTLIDQTVANEIIEKEIFDYITGSLTGIKEKEIKSLIRIVGSFNNLVDEFKSALYKIKTVRTVHSNIYNRSDEEIVKYFNEKFNQLFELIILPEIPSILSKIKIINNHVLQNQADNSIGLEVDSLISKVELSENRDELIDHLKQIRERILIKSLSLRSQSYLKKAVDEFRHYEPELKFFFSDLENFELYENHEQVSKQLASFGKIFIDNVLQVSENYSAVKKKFSYLDYEDLLFFTEQLVSKDVVRAALSDKYKYIMIDEYQDTNEVQYNIFIPILNKLNTGNLFVVGDEKQSIYMFRDAELQVFERTKEIILNKTNSAGLLELPHSFRLSPRIAMFCNKIFNRLFADPSLEFNEVKSSSLVSTRNDMDSGEIQFLLDESGEKDAEASMVALKIKEIIAEKKISFKDVAVLVRKRKSFDSLERIFIKHSIPYKILGGRGFYQQQVVFDIYSYLAFLTDKNNDTALIAVLRSPFYMISDNHLLRISYKQGESFYTKMRNSAIGDDYLSKLVGKLDKHYNISRKVDLAELIGLILKETNYWSVIASRINYKQEIANINKVLELAKNYSKHSFKTIYDFVDFLRTSIDRYEDEGQAQIPEEGDSVNLMTIHQSKGLEYEAVFLFNSHLKTQSEQVKSKSISLDKNFGIMTKLPENNNYFNEYKSAPILGIYNYSVQRKGAAEIKRLLYVAVTRAINYLYISGSVVRSAAANSFLTLIQNGLQVDELTGNIILEDKLRLMLIEGNEYKLSSEKYEFEIPVITNLNESIQFENFITNSLDINSYKINKDEIKSRTKAEIISATKINIYSQCPLKYNLTYNLGYTDLFKRFNLQEFPFINSKEDEDISSAADLEGRIIHSILEEDINESEVENKIERELLTENFMIVEDKDNIGKLTDKIKNKVLAYYGSNTFKELNKYENYRNEYEVYLKMSDYYLYGIIDKFVVTEKELLVVDYKTDSVSENKAKEKYQYYRNQLIFYAFILREHMDLDIPVKILLVFIDKPELSVTELLPKESFNDFKIFLDKTVQNIRINNYPKKYDHCSKCHFAINKKCVVK